MSARLRALVAPFRSRIRILPRALIRARQAKQNRGINAKILILQADGKTRYASEIAEILDLDVKDVVEAFVQLQEEGKLFTEKEN